MIPFMKFSSAAAGGGGALAPGRQPPSPRVRVARSIRAAHLHAPPRPPGRSRTWRAQRQRTLCFEDACLRRGGWLHRGARRHACTAGATALHRSGLSIYLSIYLSIDRSTDSPGRRAFIRPSCMREASLGRGWPGLPMYLVLLRRRPRGRSRARRWAQAGRQLHICMTASTGAPRAVGGQACRWQACRWQACRWQACRWQGPSFRRPGGKVWSL